MDFNPATFEDEYYWVYFEGDNNLLEKCYFKGKNNHHRLYPEYLVSLVVR